MIETKTRTNVGYAVKLDDMYVSEGEWPVGYTYNIAEALVFGTVAKAITWIVQRISKGNGSTRTEGWDIVGLQEVTPEPVLTVVEL